MSNVGKDAFDRRDDDACIRHDEIAPVERSIRPTEKENVVRPKPPAAAPDGKARAGWTGPPDRYNETAIDPNVRTVAADLIHEAAHAMNSHHRRGFNEEVERLGGVAASVMFRWAGQVRERWPMQIE